MIESFLNPNRETRRKVIVLGDEMVDEYVEGTVSRISPEAPIPVLLTTGKAIRRPGGAANVVEQLTHFNCDTELFSFKFNMPMKRRFFAGTHQLLRQDKELPNYGHSEEHIKSLRFTIICEFRASMETRKPDVVILSDYGKGFWSAPLAQAVLTISRNEGIPCVVDPKNSPLRWWQGCSVIKPNSKEAHALTGESDPCEQAKAIRAETGASVVITDEGRGITVAEALPDYGAELKTLPFSSRKEPVSVIGAGDCFVAVMSLALAHGLKLTDAVETGWNAAQVYCGRRHSKPVSPEELAEGQAATWDH